MSDEGPVWCGRLAIVSPRCHRKVDEKEGRNMRWLMLHNNSIMALVLPMGAVLSAATARGQDIYVTNYSYKARLANTPRRVRP